MLKVTQIAPIIPAMLNTCRALILTIAATLTLTAQAGDAAITEVTIKPAGDGMYQVSVTLLHADTGWDHYANRWDVLDEAGNLLGSRELLHPHVNEQPLPEVSGWQSLIR